MTTETASVALLRGVNVGASNRLAMADLRAALADAGLPGAQTVVQSGTVVAGSALGADEVARLVQTVLLERFGIDQPVLGRSADEWSVLVAAKPFEEAGAAVHVLFLAESPAAADAAALADGDWNQDAVAIVGREVFIRYADGSRSSAAQPARLLRELGAVGTARNWNTVERVAALIG